MNLEDVNYKAKSKWLLLISGVVLCDVLSSYIFKSQFDVSFPVNSVLPLLVIFIFILIDARYLKVPFFYLIVWIAGVIGFIIGIFAIEEMSAWHFLRIGSASCAYFIGFTLFNYVYDKNKVGILYLIISIFYVVIGVTALSGLFPNNLPVINSYWSNYGIIQARPEVFTDQNFQIFYLIPSVLAYLCLNSVFLVFMSFVLLIGAFYFLVKLQTRSGVLVFVALIYLSIVSSFYHKKISKKRILFMMLLIFIFFLIEQERLFSLFEIILARFDDPFAKNAFQGRLFSSIYGIQNILNFEYWVPQGSQEFKFLYQDVPHSNFTAMFLNAGILGAVLWLGLFLYPLIRLFVYMINRDVDVVAISVFLGAFSVMMAQLTLNVPLNTQVWFWAGATLGVICRMKALNYKD